VSTNINQKYTMHTHIQTSFYSSVAGGIKTDFTEADFSKSVVLYEISRFEVENGLVDRLIHDMRVQDDNPMIHGGPGHCGFWVSGYDDDPRELYEIPEVVAFMRKADESCPCWIYFSNVECRWLGLVAFCTSQNGGVFRRKDESKFTFALSGPEISGFLTRQMSDFDAFCALAKIPETRIRDHVSGILQSFGIGNLGK